MKHQAIVVMLSLLAVMPALARTDAVAEPAVEVRVISDNGVEYPRYRTHPACERGSGSYFYMEAVRGEKYSIRVTNRTNRRVGVVIAVDGRNIISGQKSYLKNSERMYIIEPYATDVFEGWRTGMDRTNRFYFTGQSDSYAEKVFADASAMGTIAVAAYREKVRAGNARHARPMTGIRPGQRAQAGEARRNECAKDEEAGTGFGETTYSPSYEVAFEPERSAAAGTVVLKYEWRSELCRKGIVECDRPNRLWPVIRRVRAGPGRLQGVSARRAAFTTGRGGAAPSFPAAGSCTS